MDIYETLHKEHEEVSKLFTDIEHTSMRAVKTRGRLFEQLKNALNRHSRAEEKVFYPELRKHGESHFQSLEAVEEHHVMDLLLKELSSSRKDEEIWMAKLNVLRQAVLRHVEEEERDLFPKARTFMSDTQSVELARKFVDQEKRLH